MQVFPKNCYRISIDKCGRSYGRKEHKCTHQNLVLFLKKHFSPHLPSLDSHQIRSVYTQNFNSNFNDEAEVAFKLVVFNSKETLLLTNEDILPNKLSTSMAIPWPFGRVWAISTAKTLELYPQINFPIITNSAEVVQLTNSYFLVA